VPHSRPGYEEKSFSPMGIRTPNRPSRSLVAMYTLQNGKKFTALKDTRESPQVLIKIITVCCREQNTVRTATSLYPFKYSVDHKPSIRARFQHVLHTETPSLQTGFSLNIVLHIRNDDTGSVPSAVSSPS